MGVHYVEQELDERKLQEFTQALLADLRALAFMLEHGCIESGMHRIGAEQEMFIVDRNLRPAPLALEILDRRRYITRRNSPNPESLRSYTRKSDADAALS